MPVLPSTAGMSGTFERMPIEIGTVAISGAATVLFSVLAKVSLADQVRINFRRRSVEGLSIPFYGAGILSYTSYVIFGAATHNLWILVAQAPGTILTLIVCIQWLLWRRG